MIILFSLLLDFAILTALWTSDISFLQKAAASVFLLKYELDRWVLAESR